MPKKPKCKLCGERHWVYEEHTIVARDTSPDTSATIVATIVKPTNVARGFGSGKGRAKVYASATERKAAWRERQKAYRGRK